MIGRRLPLRMVDAAVAAAAGRPDTAPDWDADVALLAAEPVHTVAGRVVVLEGAYRCRPELHVFLDLRVLSPTL